MSGLQRQWQRSRALPLKACLFLRKQLHNLIEHCKLLFAGQLHGCPVRSWFNNALNHANYQENHRTRTTDHRDDHRPPHQRGTLGPLKKLPLSPLGALLPFVALGPAPAQAPSPAQRPRPARKRTFPTEREFSSESHPKPTQANQAKPHKDSDPPLSAPCRARGLISCHIGRDLDK